MKKLKKKLRKFGFENKLDGWPSILDLKKNEGIKIRVHIEDKEWLFFKDGGFSKIDLTSFSSIKDLKKQVKEKTGIVLDKPVTKKELKKYGWVECKYLSRFMDHPKMFLNGISYNCTTKEVTIDNKPFIPCPTMSQLKAYVLEHTGEKMQKVKPRKLELPNNVVVDLNKMQKVKKGKEVTPETLKEIGFSWVSNFIIAKEGLEVKFKQNSIEVDYQGKTDFFTRAIRFDAFIKNIKQVFGIDLVQKTELPKRWEDIELDRAVKHEFVTDGSEIGTFYGASVDSKTDKNILPLGLAAPMLATCQLLLLRDVYRQGWEPDWRSKKWLNCIVQKSNNIEGNFSCSRSQIWSFQDAQTRDLFLDNFRELLQEHYKLYN